MYVRLNDGIRLFFDVIGEQLLVSGESVSERPTILLLHGGPGLDHMVFRPAFGRASAACASYISRSSRQRSQR